MDLGLAGKVVLVVGGSGLIGRATARTLIAEGATVVLAARGGERLERAAEELGAASVAFDARDAEAVASGVAEVVARHGRLDAAVITAAPSASTLDASRDRDPAQILEALDGKALGFLRVAEAVAPHLHTAGAGRIVGVSGQNARLTASVTGAVRNQVLITIAKILADAHAGTGTTVNVVNPGPVREDAEHDRPGTAEPGDSSPEEVAAAIAFLLSRQAAAISGEQIALGHRLRGVQG